MEIQLIEKRTKFQQILDIRFTNHISFFHVRQDSIEDIILLIFLIRVELFIIQLQVMKCVVLKE